MQGKPTTVLFLQPQLCSILSKTWTRSIQAHYASINTDIANVWHTMLSYDSSGMTHWEELRGPNAVLGPMWVSCLQGQVPYSFYCDIKKNFFLNSKFVGTQQ